MQQVNPIVIRAEVSNADGFWEQEEMFDTVEEAYTWAQIERPRRGSFHLDSGYIDSKGTFVFEEEVQTHDF
jgi:hypothetical protein